MFRHRETEDGSSAGVLRVESLRVKGNSAAPGIGAMVLPTTVVRKC